MARKQAQIPADIQAVLATLDATHNASRACTRCGKELTDAASVAFGVGPVCRRMDNAVLARTFRADYEAARLVIVQNAHLWAELPANLSEVWGNVVSAVESDTTDFRATCKRVEFILSFHATSRQTEALYALVAALGYRALVALWKGETCNGESFCEFAGGVLVLRSPRPSEAVRARMKAVKGCFNGKDKNWFFPAANFEAVAEMLLTHFIDINGVEAAVEAARAYVAPRNAQEERLQKHAESGDELAREELVRSRVRAGMPSADSILQSVTIRCAFEMANIEARIRAEYSAEFVADLKACVPYTHRKWNAEKKTWYVLGWDNARAAYRAALKAYGTEGVIIKGCEPSQLQLAA